MTTVILGGGIGGLSTAYYILKNSSRKVVLLETGNRIGGWVRTHLLPNGLKFEQGPRTLRPHLEAGANTLQLLSDLNLQEEIKPISAKHPAAKNRFIYVNGKLHKLPSGYLAIFRKHSPLSKPLISAVVKDWTTPPLKLEDDSIYNFIERRFGTDIAKYMISALVCGICGGDARQISVNFMMGRFFQHEQTFGSVVKGVLKNPTPMPKSDIENSLKKQSIVQRWSLYSIESGMETVPKALHKKILKMEGIVNTNCTDMKVDMERQQVSYNGMTTRFDHLVSCVPTFSLAELLVDQHPALSNELLKIQYTSIVTVNLAYTGNVLTVDGFGCLVPPCENSPILGIIFDTCVAPKDNYTVLTVMMGGHSFDQYFSNDQSESYLLDVATSHVRSMLDIKQSPETYKVSVLKDCIPQHTVGHMKRLETIYEYVDKRQLPLSFVGTAYDGAGINDVILQAKGVAHKVYAKPREKAQARIAN